MNDRIINLTERIFEGIPYSKQTEDLKERVSDALYREYCLLLESRNEIQAEGRIMSMYGDIYAASALAGFTKEETDEIISDEGCLNKPQLKKRIDRFKYILYMLAASATFLTMCIFELLFVYRGWPIILATVLLTVPVGYGCYRIYKFKQSNSFAATRLNADALDFLQAKSDMFTKRVVNTGCALLGLVSYYVFLFLNSVWNIGFRFDEALQSILTDIIIIELVLFFVYKNCLMLSTVNLFFSKKKINRFRKHLSSVVTVSLAYWAGCIALLLTVGDSETATDWMYLFIGLYIFACLVYNFTVRKRFVFENIRINKKRIAVFALCAVLVFTYLFMQLDRFLLQPYINTVSAVEYSPDKIEYNEETGVYTLTTDKEDFKILQLTDIHLGGSGSSVLNDFQALEACYTLISHTKPGLVIITGDLVFPLGVMSMSLNNSAPIMQFAAFMRNVGIPWAFTYGNHDTESIAKKNAEEIDTLLQTLSYKASRNFLYPYVQPDVYGRSNQLIELRNSDGTLNQALFLIDSNDYTGNGLNDYDYIHDDQVDWYKKQVEMLSEAEGKTVSSLMFFHIPLQEYKEASDLYADGSDEVKYFFGENKEGKTGTICCSEYPDKMFETAVELGSTKAMFCGHDHYNNMSLEYKGIRLTYGMSIDYLAMPGIELHTAQRGGTLITVHSDSTFDVEQIPLKGIK